MQSHYLSLSILADIVTLHLYVSEEFYFLLHQILIQWLY